PGPQRRNHVLARDARLCPVTTGGMEHHRAMVSATDGVCMVCRFCNAHRLGLILGRFAKSAELAEAKDKAVATGNRCRPVASELVMDPIRGQCREVALGQLNHLLEFGEKVMHLFKEAGGQDPKIQVAQGSCDSERPGPAPTGLVELASAIWASIVRA